MMYANKQKGFSLIEALVAFLIISVGMLGVASLQVLSLKAGHTASLRTMAVMKTDEILERMRSNNAVLRTYAGAGAFAGCNDYISTPAVICTPDQLAKDDILYWQASVTDTFPAGSTATVAYVTPTLAIPLSRITVTIGWQERKTEAQTMVNMTYSTVLYMFCDATRDPVDVGGGTDPAC